MVNQEEEETRAQEKQEQFGLDERKMDETERHNRVLEAAQKAAAEAKASGTGVGGKFTLTDQKLSVWKKYIKDPDSINEQEEELIGVLVDPFISKATSIIMSDLTKMALSAEKKVELILETAKLLESQGRDEPEAGPQLTEETIQLYIDEHGMTREQVIEAYNQKYGG